MKNQKLKDLVFYEIYPTSFFDSNGDGIGDLKGIENHLEHVKNLGANAIWLNPFYVSPFKDGGYDVEDFYNVDPRFGTLEDFDHLLHRAHELGIKIIIDLVAGHVSEKNKMFLEKAVLEKNFVEKWEKASVFKGLALHSRFWKTLSFFNRSFLEICFPQMVFPFPQEMWRLQRLELMLVLISLTTSA